MLKFNIILTHIFSVFFALSIACNITAAAPTFTCSPLTRSQINHHFGSNNPVKKMIFMRQHKAYAITITNSTASPIILASNQCTPIPINPQLASKKLSQSMAAAPWVCGIGWGIFATKIIGFAIIPSILLGATIIVAGIIGMSNHSLPPSTQHTITHHLLDGIHDYHINAYDQASFIIILPYGTKQLTIAHSMETSQELGVKTTLLLP